MTRHARSFFVALLGAGLLMPGIAQGDGPFQSLVAQGPFLISLGDGIKPAGDSGRFVVPSRRIFGFLRGSVNAPFMIQFAANVPIDTQSGNVHGELFICENWIDVPDLALFGCLDPTTIDLSNPPASLASSLDTASVNEAAVTVTGRVHVVTAIGPGLVPSMPRLNVNGVFTFTETGTRGHGDMNGFLTLILDPDGHITGIADSNLVFCGAWTRAAADAACPFAR